MAKRSLAKPLATLKTEGHCGNAKCVPIDDGACYCDCVACNDARGAGRRTAEARTVTEAQLEKLGCLVDKVDNLVHAGAIPMPDKLRVTALTEALPGLHSELKALYVEISGDDPWADI
jgi:hypothetical protein